MRIIGIDYGTKRVGLAVTDPLQIIPTHLGMVHPNELMDYLKKYCSAEDVEGFVVGMPKNLDNTATDSTQHVVGFIRKLKTAFPDLFVFEIDERFTSKIAMASMVSSGLNKTKRREKGMIDQVSAVIMLGDYLNYKSNFLIP